MDIAIIPSLQESFGVSAVEAQACGTLVIISDVPGLKETTVLGESSIVAKQDEKEISEVIKDFYFSRDKIKRMGIIGREYVTEHYEINDCFKHIYSLFLFISKDVEKG